MDKYDFSFKDIVEAATDVIIVTRAEPLDDPGPEIVYVNKAFSKLTGYSSEEAIGKNPRILQRADTDSETKVSIRNALDAKEPVRVTIKNYTKDNKPYWLDLSILPLKDSQGKVTHFVAIERDVTAQKELELELDTLSNTDPLTSLLNRRSFDEVINKEMSRFIRSQQVFSVLMMDIDYFKSINDQHGHPVGDKILEVLADTCRRVFRVQDCIARVGGEEFCILLPNTDLESAEKSAERIRKAIEKITVQNVSEEVVFTVSIGVSEVDEMDASYEDLLIRADKALYQAKDAGRNRVVISEV